MFHHSNSTGKHVMIGSLPPTEKSREEEWCSIYLLSHMPSNKVSHTDSKVMDSTLPSPTIKVVLSGLSQTSIVICQRWSFLSDQNGKRTTLSPNSTLPSPKNLMDWGNYTKKMSKSALNEETMMLASRWKNLPDSSWHYHHLVGVTNP